MANINPAPIRTDLFFKETLNKEWSRWFQDLFNNSDEKADKATPGTAGDFATLDSDGNLSDSGKTPPSGEVIGTTDSQTLTNKVIDADNNTVSNLAHGSEVDNPSSGVHGVVGSVVGTSDSQTLTNKVIDADNNTVSNLAHGSEVDSPSSGVHGVVGSVVGTSDSQTLTNKTLTDSTTYLQDDADDTKKAQFQCSTIGTGTTKTFTFPNATGTLVLEAAAQTLTNKVIDADNSTISNLAHGAEVDNPSSGVHGVVGSVVGTSDSQTLTSKTITSPIISNATVSTNAVYDGSKILTSLSPAAHIADATTTHTITDPADAPVDADALRDDLVANTIPSIESALDALGTKVNSILSAIESAYITNTS